MWTPRSPRGAALTALGAERELSGVDVKLDHLMWAAPTLDRGVGEVRELFGVEPAPGGSHPGLGTRNALLAVGDDVYLEVIAPDPAQALEGTFGAQLAGLAGCGLVTWAIASDDLRGIARSFAKQGLETRGPVRSRRTAPDGSELVWDLLFVRNHGHRGLLPFFIDWRGCPHPARYNPRAGTALTLTIESPDAGRLRALLSNLDDRVAICDAPAPQLRARIEGRRGVVELDATAETLALAL